MSLNQKQDLQGEKDEKAAIILKEEQNDNYKDKLL